MRDGLPFWKVLAGSQAQLQYQLVPAGGTREFLVAAVAVSPGKDVPRSCCPREAAPHLRTCSWPGDGFLEMGLQRAKDLTDCIAPTTWLSLR